jgi:RNA methyltransferase, TrmH family
MSELLSPRNPKVAQSRDLARDRSARESLGLAVLEGVRLAEEAVAAGVPIEYALYTEDLARKERGAALLAALAAAGVSLHAVAPDTLARAADTQAPQGILAVFRPRPWRLEQMPPGLVVVLDNLQDPGNLGTIIRSLEALGGAGLCLAGGVDPYNPKVVRAAMGSLFRLPVVGGGEIGPVLTDLKQQGRRVLVADAGGELMPWTAGLAGNVALVIGNEGNGPSDTARRLADSIISIPMDGPTESLNAGVAASLLIYEAMRQRAGRPGTP